MSESGSSVTAMVALWTSTGPHAWKSHPGLVGGTASSLHPILGPCRLQRWPSGDLDSADHGHLRLQVPTRPSSTTITCQGTPYNDLTKSTTPPGRGSTSVTRDRSGTSQIGCRRHGSHFCEALHADNQRPTTPSIAVATAPSRPAPAQHHRSSRTVHIRAREREGLADADTLGVDRSQQVYHAVGEEPRRLLATRCRLIQIGCLHHSAATFENPSTLTTSAHDSVASAHHYATTHTSATRPVVPQRPPPERRREKASPTPTPTL
jgi:hypothetical protein